MPLPCTFCSCLAGGQPHALCSSCGHLPPHAKLVLIVSFDPKPALPPSGRTATCCRGTVPAVPGRFPISSKFSDEELGISHRHCGHRIRPAATACGRCAAGAVHLRQQRCPRPIPAPAHGFTPCRKVRLWTPPAAGDGVMGSFLWQLKRGRRDTGKTGKAQQNKAERIPWPFNQFLRHTACRRMVPSDSYPHP